MSMLSHMKQYIMLCALCVVLANGKSFQGLVKELKLNPSNVSSAGNEILLPNSKLSPEVAERRHLNELEEFGKIAILATAGICNVGHIAGHAGCFLAEGVAGAALHGVAFFVGDEDQCENSRVPPRHDFFGWSFGQERRNYNKGCGMEVGLQKTKLVRCGDRKACCCPDGTFWPSNDFAQWLAIIKAGPRGCFPCARKPRCEDFVSRKQCREWQNVHNCDCNALNVRESIDDFEILRGACRDSDGTPGTYTVADSRTCENDCRKDPSCFGFEINLDPSSSYCELHTQRIDDVEPSASSLCLIKKSAIRKVTFRINSGACRTSNGGLGTYTTANLGPGECHRRCLTSEKCVAYETQTGSNRCELHTESIAYAEPGKPNLCFVKD